MTADQEPNTEGTDENVARSAADLRVIRSLQPTDARSEASSEQLATSADGSDSAPSEPDVAEDWVFAAQAGDADAFRRLVETYQDRVYRVVINVLRCDRARAEDFCQEVFLRVFRGLPSFDGSSRIGAWIHTIATNVAITEYRKRRTLKRDRRTMSIDAPVAGTDDLYMEPVGHERDPADLTHQKDFVAKVRECVQKLPEEFRDAVVLRDMEGLAYEEIATVLRLAPGTVRSRIHRGRLALQKMLEEFQP